MIDSHCHLADEAFIADLAAIVSRSTAAGLTHAICILAAESRTEIARAGDITRLWPNVRFAVGLHPHQAGLFDGRESDVDELVRTSIGLLPYARAVGEIGLDYHYDFAPKPAQHAVFRTQIRLARQLDLPIVIHTREAEADTLAILREEGGTPVRGVLHCFTGTRGFAEQGLELGLHISFAGIVTFPKAADLREIARSVPAERLLCETDSPYLAPAPHRGKRNEPAWVVRVAEELARIRDVPAEALSARMRANFIELFRP